MNISEKTEEEIFERAVDVCIETWSGLVRKPKIKINIQCTEFLNDLALKMRTGEILKENGMQALALCSVCTFSVYEMRIELEKIRIHTPNTVILLEQLDISIQDKAVLYFIIYDTVQRNFADNFLKIDKGKTKYEADKLLPLTQRYLNAYFSFRNEVK
jgi:hypothetical protein